MRDTIGAIKASIGGFVGHSGCHPDLLSNAEDDLERARKSGLLIDYRVTGWGDDGWGL